MNLRAPPRRTAIGRLAVASAAAWVGLSGCAGSWLPKPPQPPARFTLDGPPATAAARSPAAERAPAPGAPVLVVAVPRAAPGFDSTRMVYLRRTQELEAFAFHEWVDTPARMLAPLLVRSLQASGAYSAVLLAPSAATGALRLETELIRLQQDFGSRPSEVRMTLRAVLMDTATRQVIAWREFDETVTAGTDDPAGGAAAAHQAMQRVLAALSAFCAGQAAR